MRKGTSIVRNARFQDSIAARLGWGRDGDWIPSPLGVGSSFPPPPPFGFGAGLSGMGGTLWTVDLVWVIFAAWGFLWQPVGVFFGVGGRRKYSSGNGSRYDPVFCLITGDGETGKEREKARAPACDGGG